MSPSVEDNDGEGETTLYFDAEEGLLRTESGTEVTFDMSEDSTTNASEEPESQQDGEDDGSRTPQATQAAGRAGAAQTQYTPQTITSMSPSGTPELRRRRPSLARRLGTATQSRVSCPYFLVTSC